MDAAIVEWLNAAVGKFGPFDRLMELLMSDYFVPVLGSLLLIALWFWGRGVQLYQNQLTTVAAISGLGLANLAVSLLNVHVSRLRPFAEHDILIAFYEPTDSSFPSNSAATGFAMATAVFVKHRPLGLVCYALSFLWAFGRVYAGVHYPTDVLAGAAIGIVASILAWALIWALRIIPRIILAMFRRLVLA